MTHILTHTQTHISSPTLPHIPLHTKNPLYHQNLTYPKKNLPRYMCSIQNFCIHHQNNNMGTYEQLNQLTYIANNLSIQQLHTQIATHIPPDTLVNTSKKWSKVNYPNTPILNETSTPQLPNYQTNLPLRFHPQFSYYTYGSFKNPKEILPGTWRREKAGHGIYSYKGLSISKRLHGHQNILCAEMIATHETLCIINNQYLNEPAYIFTDSLNVLYLLNTQIKHLTLHNSHPTKSHWPS